jgi:hypothetical protein
MNSKTCFRCIKDLALENFYRHSQMADGYSNKCKSCTKSEVKINYAKKSKDPLFIENERERGREKYKRLNYKDRNWNELKPWTKDNLYKNLSRKLNPKKGLELHHWNYNDEFLEDVFFIDRKNHKLCHKYLIIDIKLRLFMDLESNLLDTKQKHYEYLISKGIKIEK